ncbi:hypothetical protein Acid345_4408 [Candidatus Koribacter versatilis Ellin345]|uniref:Uncharacterized protein n=1 Tax=Koribacter versatilis (strain Ellin345) TaxID=204669 RepID=Q1II92_KORVE|nr:hypothetical protein [Candidatus Koribacter versatilis]ABF43408.1 hypothetical protein Acid345_4408 [Candidatus Koribacter versatilis Ellin345]
MRFLYGLFLVFVALPLVAQTSTADMLVRIERVQSAEDSRCIVVYSDSSYHAERTHGSKTDVFEGTLDSARYAPIKDLAAGPLKQVQHEHISARYVDSPDLLLIDVDRGDDIQQIRFANKADRKPYATQLDPVLQWFDATMKQPGARSAAKADRCVPEKRTITKIVSGIPEKQLPTGPENPYHIKNLLLLFITERYESRGNSAGEKNCVLVRNDGSIYAYKMTVAWRGEPDKYREMHVNVSPDQVTILKRAMDDPTLANAKDIHPEKRSYASESDRTEVVAVRNNDVQVLHFAQLVNAEEVGATPRQGYQPVKGSDGSKETAPVREWIKLNLDNSKLQKVDHLSGECP